MPSNPFTLGVHPADFVTIALLVMLEGLLSADNAMVLAVLVLGLPKNRQKQALRYGILGAFAFRATATLQLARCWTVPLAGGGVVTELAPALSAAGISTRVRGYVCWRVGSRRVPRPCSRVTST